ncbi:hypothetical protein GQ55_1G447700 [Panicum hallii var. hallii]|uniref:Uncharacterized protein n=1 Tax=Panicum hallii var. hallii TaxID=1504633 RepID=A0A2T7FE63_9POAL|nr:hypothetical protein GQ55_1G447700 [Panicum hallii var. hallii]
MARQRRCHSASPHCAQAKPSNVTASMISLSTPSPEKPPIRNLILDGHGKKQYYIFTQLIKKNIYTRAKRHEPSPELISPVPLGGLVRSNRPGQKQPTHVDMITSHKHHIKITTNATKWPI